MLTPNQPRYTPADIERYLNGKMSAEESYALEQAAWQDPLLEAAIDGFLAAKEQGIATSPFVQSLEERIQLASQQQPTATMARVVPLVPSSRGWKSIAAVVLAISALSLGLWIMFQPSQETATPVANSKTNTPKTPVIAQEPPRDIASAPPSTPSKPLKVVTKPRQEAPPAGLTVETDSNVPMPITETSSNPYKPAPELAIEQPKQPALAVEANEDLSAARNQELTTVEIAASNQAPRNQELTTVEIAASNQAPRNQNFNDQRVRVAEITREAYRAKESNKKLAKSENEHSAGGRLPTRRFTTAGLSPVGGWENLERTLAEQIQQNPNCTGINGQLVTAVLTNYAKEPASSQWRLQAKRISAACEEQLLQVLRAQTWEYSGKSATPEIQWVF